MLFVERGFSNWRKATAKFSLHKKSTIHRDAIRTLVGLQQTPISALLSDIASKEQQTAKNVLEILFHSISLLGRKGLPFRGETIRDGRPILSELMFEQTYNLPKEREWMMRRDNWISNIIQNEIITPFAHSVRRTVVLRIRL